MTGILHSVSFELNLSR